MCGRLWEHARCQLHPCSYMFKPSAFGWGTPNTELHEDVKLWTRWPGNAMASFAWWRHVASTDIRPTLCDETPLRNACGPNASNFVRPSGKSHARNRAMLGTGPHMGSSRRNHQEIPSKAKPATLLLGVPRYECGGLLMTICCGEFKDTPSASYRWGSGSSPSVRYTSTSTRTRAGRQLRSDSNQLRQISAKLGPSSVNFVPISNKLWIESWPSLWLLRANLGRDRHRAREVDWTGRTLAQASTRTCHNSAAHDAGGANFSPTPSSGRPRMRAHDIVGAAELCWLRRMSSDSRAAMIGGVGRRLCGFGPCAGPALQRAAHSRRRHVTRHPGSAGDLKGPAVADGASPCRRGPCAARASGLAMGPMSSRWTRGYSSSLAICSWSRATRPSASRPCFGALRAQTPTRRAGGEKADTGQILGDLPPEVVLICRPRPQ